MTLSLLLTFDVEEFSLPADLSRPVAEATSAKVVEQGAEVIIDICARGLPATCFVTKYFATCHPKMVRDLAGAGCEIASHGVSHFETFDGVTRGDQVRRLRQAKEGLEDLTGQPVRGYRSPKFAPVALDVLKEAGFLYDSSTHPTWVPGRYNYLREPVMPWVRDGLAEVPVSVLPILRIPFSWIWFRSFPELFLKWAGRACLDRQGVLCVYFHNWEFVALENYDLALPRVFTRGTGEPLLKRLERWIGSMRRHGAEPQMVFSYVNEHLFP